MRQAAVIAFRTARLAPSRILSIRGRAGFQSSNYVLGARFASGRPSPTSKPSLSSKIIATHNSSASMHIRRLSVAIVSGLVGYGAWYTYKGNGTDLRDGLQQSKGFSTSTIYSNPTLNGEPAAAEIERKAIIIGADSIYTGAIQGDGPISKDTDTAGRKVLEMLTPEQATQKLRRNEESYLVGRGKGVVRYDVVQIPSNDPIEDDHAEKIIELPQALATATAAQDSTSDWMFWGVFDGHAYVFRLAWADTS
jgi:pyruvate dehydrogenase phosphatase